MEKNMEEKLKLIGANIRVLREANKYTQSEVATFLGLNDHVTISYYENGDRNIPLDHLKKIADLFGVELTALFVEDPNERTINKVFAFRKEDLNEKDFSIIAEFNKIVKNYIKLIRLETKHAIES